MVTKEQVESAVVSRVNDKLELAAPGFDPLIIDVLISLLTDLLSGCFGAEKLKPEDAVERVKNLSRFQQSALRSRLSRKAKERKIKDAASISRIAADAVVQVAKEATPEEQIEFARQMLPLADDSVYNWI